MVKNAQFVNHELMSMAFVHADLVENKKMKPDCSDPDCPICERPKEQHTPSEALNCFNKIRGDI
jgi:hypothetical protein